jgi:tripartite-type tricarboxylate transporter receptor subunit TctC
MQALHWLPAAIVGSLLFAGGAHAQQGYPNKPIRLIVPFPPGGQTDVVARTLSLKLADAFGQPVVVDNRPGAAGSIGAELAVRAPSDGYTVIMVSGSCNRPT